MGLFATFLAENFDDENDEFEDENNETQEQMVQDRHFGTNDYIPFRSPMLHEAMEPHNNPKRLVVWDDRPNKSGASGVVVPKHVWVGAHGVYSKGKNKGKKYHIAGMRERNEKRAKVYGKENREPLSIKEMTDIHKNTLDEHFAKPKHEQVAAEQKAINRLHDAGHLDSKDTTDGGEKTDTVKFEHDDDGRSYRARSSKGVAGHAFYTSGRGENEKHHVLNTCPGQTEGCGGGISADGLADTSNGSCFAPNAENQYPAAAIRRACHEQAKHDPAMTRDWVLAHVGSIRKHAALADRSKQRLLFRPNVVDETDQSSVHAIHLLNKQRAEETRIAKEKKGDNFSLKDDRPFITSNSYSKVGNLHDPDRGIFETHSNVGPKVKNGSSIPENISRDKKRIGETILAQKHGKDEVNSDGVTTPPRGSYMVTNMKRNSPISKEFEKHVTHAKYWSAGREHEKLSPEEKAQGDEGHYDGDGKPTTPDKAHYGHKTIKRDDVDENGNSVTKHIRYDYQKQHILHPRIVTVHVKTRKKQPDGTTKTVTEEHHIPTDSRFLDTKFLPDDKFKAPNRKTAGHIMVTTPTESTDNLSHHTAFTHHVDHNTIERAKANNGEYEVDRPEDQEAARGRKFVAPKAIHFESKRDKPTHNTTRIENKSFKTTKE